MSASLPIWLVIVDQSSDESHDGVMAFGPYSRMTCESIYKDVVAETSDRLPELNIKSITIAPMIERTFRTADIVRMIERTVQ
jgi:hypothetical protein